MGAGVGEPGETAGAMNDPEAGRSTLGLPSEPHPDLPFLTSPTQAVLSWRRLRTPRPEGEVGIQPHSSQMRRNYSEGKKKINSIVSTPRSCLKNKNKIKPQLGRLYLAKLSTRGLKWWISLNPQQGRERRPSLPRLWRGEIRPCTSAQLHSD